MDTLPLPPRPDLEQYRKRAKELVAVAKTGDTDRIRAWASDWLRALAKLTGAEITPFVQDSFDRAVEAIAKRVIEKTEGRKEKAEGEKEKAESREFGLADAQFVIARAHGFENWSDFAIHITGPRDAVGREFEAAADAVVDGDIDALRSMLHDKPGLIRARSPRSHKVTLLHYVAANGVEDFRQKTPPNAIEVARVLLENGAEVDAIAETYGGGKGQTTMNLLVSSAHPAGAGLQGKLAEVLLDHGASINGLEDDGSPIMTAVGFWYGDTAETLARRGARLDNAVVAAAVGRLDVVKRMVIDKETLSSDVRVHETVWYKVPRDAKSQIEMAAAKAAHFRRYEIVDFLLGIGVSPRAKDLDDMTLLHWAAGTGNLELVDRLVKAGAQLEAENRWGGTVLGSTTHAVMHGPVPGADYVATIEALLRLGADVRWADYPTGNAGVDAVLARWMRN
jgi:ankyrin repeat protein